jgi:HPt (histidine-containing phosphotransfer) domain-containing protein
MSQGPLDRDFLDELLDGDREFGQELLAAFDDASNQWLTEARAACQSGDTPKAVRAFHTLKGSAGSVGLSEVREVASDLEIRAKEGDLNACAAGLEQLDRRVQEGRALLADFLGSL